MIWSEYISPNINFYKIHAHIHRFANICKYLHMLAHWHPAIEFSVACHRTFCSNEMQTRAHCNYLHKEKNLRICCANYVQTWKSVWKGVWKNDKHTHTCAHKSKIGEENQRRYACRELKVKKYKTVRCKE